MGCNLLRHASLSLYNHLDTHKAQHYDTIFNHRIDIYIAISICIADPYSVLVPCMRMHVRAYVCGYVFVYIRTSEFKSPRVCQDILQEWYI